MSESREEREELKALSKEVFGVPSRYRKLYATQELITHKVAETVPGENGEPDTTKLVEVPLLQNGVKQYRSKYRSTEEVLQLLRDFKVKRDEYMAQVKKQQEEAKAKKEAEEKLKRIQEDLTGSAIT